MIKYNYNTGKKALNNYNLVSLLAYKNKLAMELHNVTSMKKVTSFLHTEFFLNLFEILLCCTKRVKKAATL